MSNNTQDYKMIAANAKINKMVRLYNEMEFAKFKVLNK
jgi:hypothetical protein